MEGYKIAHQIVLKINSNNIKNNWKYIIIRHYISEIRKLQQQINTTFFKNS